MVVIWVVILAIVAIVAFLIMGAARRLEWMMARGMMHIGIVLIIVLIAFLLIHGISLPKSVPSLGSTTNSLTPTTTVKPSASTESLARQKCAQRGVIVKVTLLHEEPTKFIYKCDGTAFLVAVPR